MTFRFRTLGGVSVEGPDGPVTGRAAQRRRLAVLSILAVAPRGHVSRDRIVSYLWPETDQEKARHLLSDALYTLRKALGEDAIGSLGDEELRLDPEVVQSDVAAFEAAVDAGELERAVGFYEGEFLSGFHISDSPGFMEWAEQQRRRLSTRYGEVLESLASAAEARGDRETAVRWWQKRAAHDPLDSRAALALMAAHAAAGNPAAALRHARVHELLLGEELGIDLPREIAELAERLREGSGGILEADRPRTGPDASPDDTLRRPPVDLEDGPAPGSTPASLSADPARRLRRPLAAAMAVLVVFVAGIALLTGIMNSPERGATATPDPSLVAVLPFRVTGADSSMDDLREGMVDLLVHRLGTAEQLRAVDSRTLIGSWERAGGGERDLPLQAALDLAEGLGAGRLLLGEMVSLSDRVTLSATLYDVTTGTAESAVTEEGRRDSIIAVVERLAVRVLSLDAAPAARLASITTGSLAALLPYLAGEAAYRRAQWDDALRAFARAVDHDSTFALAALMAARARDKAGAGTVEGDFAARAWRYRDRLGPRERAYMEVYGSNFLGYMSPSALLASLQRLVALLPDDPDAWFMLGERIPHSMARAGASDTLTLRYAAEAYRKAHALDPGYMIGLMQLQLAEAALGDTAAAFRLAREYLARVPDGREADQFRCVLKGASGAGILRSEDLAGLGPVAIGRCLYDLNGLYPYAHEARDTIAAYLDRQSESSEVMQLAGGMMYLVALDRGRPAQAKRYVDAMHQASLVSWADHVSSVIRDALYGGADSTAASTAATEIGARLARSDPGLSESDRIEVLCALGQWHASRSDFADAALEADRLRALSRAEETNTHMRAVHCARLLDAWVAFGTGAPDLDGRVTALNDMLIDGAHDARLLRESAFLLARIHEARGRPALGLEAIDRARFTRPAATYAAAFFRERGRLAAMVGDTAGARDSFRRYLSRRTDPEAHVQAEVDRVREELESLGG